jgi:hypothetical protein
VRPCLKKNEKKKKKPPEFPFNQEIKMQETGGGGLKFALTTASQH